MARQARKAKLQTKSLTGGTGVVGMATSGMTASVTMVSFGVVDES
jgi:hypothetical protein